MWYDYEVTGDPPPPSGNPREDYPLGADDPAK